jgi:hypothetical protein
MGFTYLWLYGAVEPLTGASFFYEFTHLDTVCFEKFLELFASDTTFLKSCYR